MRGRLLARHDSLPLRGVRLMLIPAWLEKTVATTCGTPDSWQRTLIQVGSDASTDEQGRFVIGGVPDQNALLLVIGAPPSALEIVPIHKLPADGATVDLGDLTLTEPVAVRGRIVDDRGRPVSGARVRHATASSEETATFPPEAIWLARDSGDIDAWQRRLMIRLRHRLTTAPGNAELRRSLARLVRQNSRVTAGPVPRRRTLHALLRSPPETIANAKGEFAITDVAPGHGALIVTAPHHRSRSFEILVDRGAPLEVGTLHLTRGRTVRGTVSLTADEAASGVLVTAGTLPPTALSHREPMPPPVRTDARGAFAIGGVGAGPLYIAVRPTAWSPWTVHGPFSDGARPDVRLGEARAAEIVVTDPSGKPIDASLEVCTKPPQGGLPIRVPDRCLLPRGSTENVHPVPGEWVLHAYAGVYELAASAPGFLPRRVELGFGRTAIPMQPADLASEVAVRIVDLGGKPIGGVRIRCGERVLATTDANGKALLAEVQPGSCVDLVAWHPSFCVATARIASFGAEPDCEIRMSRSARLVGAIYDNGRPAEGTWHVVARPQRGGNTGTNAVDLPRTIRTSARGDFELSGLAPGEWRVTAHRGSDRAAARVFRLRPGKRHELKVPVVSQEDDATAQIRGIVRRNGEPMVNTTVQVGHGEAAPLRATTDFNGRFTIDVAAGTNLRDATLMIVGTAGGLPQIYERRKHSFDLEQTVDLTMTTGSLVLDVVDRAGQPVPGRVVLVERVSATGTRRTELRAQTNAAGRVRIESAPKGTYRVRFAGTNSGYADKMIEIAAFRPNAQRVALR